MLEVFQKTIDFLDSDLSLYAPYIVASLIVSFIAIFIIEAVLTTVKTAEYSTVYYLGYLIFNLVATTYFSVEDLLGLSVIFKTTKSIYAFITLLSLLSIILFIVVKTLNLKWKIKSVKPQKNLEKKEELIPSRVVEYFNSGEPFSGYLDVNYTKSLIANLKTKNLTEDDFQKIEDLELYLLRFTSRQPTKNERTELSEKLSMLMKKLAEYAS